MDTSRFREATGFVPRGPRAGALAEFVAAARPGAARVRAGRVPCWRRSAAHRRGRGRPWLTRRSSTSAAGDDPDGRTADRSRPSSRRPTGRRPAIGIRRDRGRCAEDRRPALRRPARARAGRAAGTADAGAGFTDHRVGRVAGQAVEALRTAPVERLRELAEDPLRAAWNSARGSASTGSSPGRRRGLHPLPVDRRLRGRRVRLRPRVDRAIFLPLLRPLVRSWFRVEVRGAENLPDRRLGAAGLQPRGHHAARRDGAAHGRLRRDRPARPHARRGPDLQDPVLPRPRPQDGHHAGLPGGRRTAARLRRAGLGLPGGLQGPRQAVRGPLQAAALRPWRLRLGRRPRPGADHPGLHRRLRGDLPADRAGARARPGARGARTSR